MIQKKIHKNATQLPCWGGNLHTDCLFIQTDNVGLFCAWLRPYHQTNRSTVGRDTFRNRHTWTWNVNKCNLIYLSPDCASRVAKKSSAFRPVTWKSRIFTSVDPVNLSPTVTNEHTSSGKIQRKKEWLSLDTNYTVNETSTRGCVSVSISVPPLSHSLQLFTSFFSNFNQLRHTGHEMQFLPSALNQWMQPRWSRYHTCPASFALQACLFRFWLVNFRLKKNLRT